MICFCFRFTFSWNWIEFKLNLTVLNHYTILNPHKIVLFDHQLRSIISQKCIQWPNIALVLKVSVELTGFLYCICHCSNEVFTAGFYCRKACSKLQIKVIHCWMWIKKQSEEKCKHFNGQNRIFSRRLKKEWNYFYKLHQIHCPFCN